MTLKKEYLKIIGILTLVLTVSFAAQAWAGWRSGEKVGFVNLNRLVTESHMGKAAQKKINTLRQAKEAELKTKLEEINAVKLELQTQGATLNDSAKKDKVDTLNSLTKEYKRMQADAKEEIERQDRDLVADILKKADGILKKVAKKKGFGIILKDPKVVGYLNPDLDITEDVLKELNK